MREHPFRGKRVDTGEWVEGCFCYDGEGGACIEEINNLGLWEESHTVNASTVGQCTGLTDKNGVKIFEGDIVRMNNNPLDMAQICFGPFSVVGLESEAPTDTAIGWHWKPIKTDALSALEPLCLPFQLNEFWIKRNDIKVIGNIHDDPEWIREDCDETD